MNIEVRIAANDELKQWDELIELSSYGTIFHTLSWLKTVEKHGHYKLYPIIGCEGSEIIGVCPLFFQKRKKLKSVFSPPYHAGVPYLGPSMIYTPEQKESSRGYKLLSFINHMDDFIYSTLKPNYVSINTLPGLLDCRPFKWNKYQVEPLYTNIIELNRGEGYVWGLFTRKLRQSINKAINREVIVEEGSVKELLTIYDFLVARYEEQGREVNVSKKYLLELYDIFHSKNMRISVARYKGEIVSGIIDLYYKNKIVSWIGNPKTNIKSLAPNDLLCWESIKWGIKHNFLYYEDLGANTQRLYEYKRKYNLFPSIYFSARKYNPFLIKWLEGSYFKFIKPISFEFNMRKKGN